MLQLLHDTALNSTHWSVDGQPIRPNPSPESEQVHIQVSAPDPDPRVRVETAAHTHWSNAHLCPHQGGFGPGTKTVACNSLRAHRSEFSINTNRSKTVVHLDNMLQNN